MALTFASKADGKDDTSNTVYTTGSVTPNAGAGYLLWVSSGSSTATPLAPNVPPTSVTGLGLTWTQVASQASPNGALSFSVWRAYAATSTTGAVTVTWAASQDSFAYKLVEVTGQYPSSAGMVSSANQSVLGSGAASPSGNLPNAQASGDRILSGIASNAGNAVVITAGSTNSMALVGAMGGGSLNPALQLGVEAGGNGTSWDWNTGTSQASKALISFEVVQAPPAPPPGGGTGPSVQEKTSSSSVAGGPTFTTAAINPVAGSGYVLWVATGSTGAAVAPASVSGLGLTWVKITEIASGNVNINLSAWRAFGLNPSGTALTITYAASVVGVVEWKLDEIGGMATSGVNGSGFIRAGSTTTNVYVTTGNVATTLAQASQNGNTVLCGAVMNSGNAQTISAGTVGTYGLIGGALQANGAGYAASLAVEATTNSQTTADWTTTSTSAKVVLALEIVAEGSTSPLIVSAGPDVVFDAYDTIAVTAAASGGTGGTTYAWTRLSYTGLWAPTLTGAATATVGFAATPDRTGNTVTLQVTATDSSNATSTDTVVVKVAAWQHWTQRAGVLAVRRKRTIRVVNPLGFGLGGFGSGPFGD